MSEQGGILVSEDDPDDLFFLKRAFARAGLAERTTFVKDGSGVIKYLAGVAPYENRELHPLPKLVLLDLAMPEVSGLEVLQWLRGQTMPTEIPIVVFTGTEAPGQIHRALSLGARRCLPKTGAVNGWGDMIQHLAVEFGICPLIPALSLQPGETRKAA